MQGTLKDFLLISSLLRLADLYVMEAIKGDIPLTAAQYATCDEARRVLDAWRFVDTAIPTHPMQQLPDPQCAPNPEKSSA